MENTAWQLGSLNPATWDTEAGQLVVGSSNLDALQSEFMVTLGTLS